MLDILLAHHLLKALEPGTHLLLVGDVDQLPSVGAGDVLRDVIASGLRVIYPAEWFVDTTEIVLLAVSLYATVVLWRVFPFDFEDSDFPWDLLTHALLILAIVGTAIGIVFQIVKTLRHLST